MMTLKINDRGEEVKKLQELLNLDSAVSPKVKVDGKFGNKTKKAVKQYQTAHKLQSDGVVGTLTWSALLGKDLKKENPVDYKQYDSRWGSKLYTSSGNKNQTMSKSGCGPTAMADVVATFIDNSITPYDLAQFSVKNGHRTKNDGTAWTFFKAIFKKYPFSKFVQTSKYDDFVSHISKGALVVCSMKPGYWTKGGHFICAWKHDGKYVYANDPASSSRTRQLASDFKKECKQYFIFYPPIGWEDPNDDIGEPTTPPTEPQTPPSEPLPYNGPTGIYDISKWQGNVDFKKVKESNKVGLLILRAGYGQNTIDPRFKEYVTECQKYNIPYGVYWFSYATSVDGARREAESFYKIASPYKPLFYVMDAEDRRVDGSYINAFATRIKEVSGGAKTGLYVANHLFAEYKREGMNLSLWDFIWIPKYTKDPPTWRPCDVWQTGGSRIPGFSGNIDTNVIPSFGRYKIEYYLGWRD